MNLTEDMIILAKQGDKKVLKKISDSCEKTFCNNVVRFTGKKEDKKRAKEILPKLVEDYFKIDYKQDLYSYLRHKKESIFSNRGKFLSECDYVNSEDDRKYIVERYYMSIYEVVEKYKNLLDENELINFSKRNIYRLIDSVQKSEDFTNSFMANLNKEIKRLENEDAFIKRYLLLCGKNKKIHNYLIKKYNYLLSEYKNTCKYEFLKENFKEIVSKAIDNLASMQFDLESLIKDSLACKLKTEFDIQSIIIGAKNGNKEDAQKLKGIYSYMKSIIYKDYVGKFDKETLIALIDTKYEDYMNAYINGICNRSIPSYLKTRFKDFFSQKDMKKQEIIHYKKNKNFVEELKSNNENLVDKKLKKVDAFISNSKIKEELNDCYDLACIEYGKKERKTPFRSFINSILSKKVEELNEKYGITYIDSLSDKVKNGVKTSKIIDDDIFDGVFDSWVSYYINSEIYKEIDFEQFLFNSLRKYNEEDYRRIIDVREHINCKVLKR